LPATASSGQKGCNQLAHLLMQIRDASADLQWVEGRLAGGVGGVNRLTQQWGKCEMHFATDSQKYAMKCQEKGNKGKVGKAGKLESTARTNANKLICKCE